LYATVFFLSWTVFARSRPSKYNPSDESGAVVDNTRPTGAAIRRTVDPGGDGTPRCAALSRVATGIRCSCHVSGVLPTECSRARRAATPDRGFASTRDNTALTGRTRIFGVESFDQGNEFFYSYIS